MKIKQTKRVNLLQLLKWCWENNKGGDYTAINDNTIVVGIDKDPQLGTVDTSGWETLPDKNSVFEIEYTIDVDENTILNKAVATYRSHGADADAVVFTDKSIAQIVGHHDAEHLEHELTQINHINPDGTMTLLWEDSDAF